MCTHACAVALHTVSVWQRSSACCTSITWALVSAPAAAHNTGAEEEILPEAMIVPVHQSVPKAEFPSQRLSACASGASEHPFCAYYTANPKRQPPLQHLTSADSLRFLGDAAVAVFCGRQCSKQDRNYVLLSKHSLFKGRLRSIKNQRCSAVAPGVTQL